MGFSERFVTGGSKTMGSWPRRALVVVGVIGLFGVSFWMGVRSTPGARVTAAPLQGTPVRLLDGSGQPAEILLSHRDSPVVLLALSVDCRYCEANMPNWVRLADAIQGSPSPEVLVVSISPRHATERYLARHGLAAPVLFAEPSDLRLLGVTGTPATVLVAPGVAEAAVWTGPLSGAQTRELEGRVRQMTSSTSIARSGGAREQAPPDQAPDSYPELQGLEGRDLLINLPSAAPRSVEQILRAIAERAGIHVRYDNSIERAAMVFQVQRTSTRDALALIADEVGLWYEVPERDLLVVVDAPIVGRQLDSSAIRSIEVPELATRVVPAGPRETVQVKLLFAPDGSARAVHVLTKPLPAEVLAAVVGDAMRITVSLRPSGDVNHHFSMNYAFDWRSR